ncbi:hypothetical protein KUTeg_013258 [Tegillarca granosa]|uniref:Uncharacterized protein n=1 Tax=Tegillarca granosa TaxID=220873 RepID=A0ABQ9ETJ3_TEGGR|nr:hypothetical protein KUTeg_013258 [Tegillarca granosa]
MSCFREMEFKRKVLHHFARNKRFYKYGVPFIVTIVGSSFIMEQFQVIVEKHPISKEEKEIREKQMFEEMVAVKEDYWENLNRLYSKPSDLMPQQAILQTQKININALISLTRNFAYQVKDIRTYYKVLRLTRVLQV